MRPARGRLIVYAGPMGAGKTNLLLWRLSNFKVARKTALLLTLATAQRGGDEEMGTLTSRLGASMTCRALPSPELMPLLEEARQFHVVGIDEGQFFPDIVDFVSALVDEHGRTVVVATLLRDFRRRLWPNRVHELLADADERPVLPAACAGCGSEAALFTRKKHGKGNAGEVVEIGGMDMYESVCRRCWAEREREFDLLQFGDQ